MSFGEQRFDLDLVKGEVGEDFVRTLLRQDVKVEVKTIDAFKYVPIEFESRGKFSGILKNEADYYAFVFTRFNSLVVMIPRWRLLELCNEYKKCVTGGDNGTSKMWLIPFDAFFTEKNE